MDNSYSTVTAVYKSCYVPSESHNIEDSQQTQSWIAFSNISFFTKLRNNKSQFTFKYDKKCDSVHKSAFFQASI